MSFESIAVKFPAERTAIIRLQGELTAHFGDHSEYDLNRLCELVEPNSREGFIEVLGELVRLGTLRQVIRLISPSTQGGIGDFTAVNEIPEIAHDWRTNTEFDVSTDDLRIVYIT